MNFLVRGWYSMYGADTWDKFKASPGPGYGQSSLGYLTLGGGALPIPSAFGPGDGQVDGLYVIISPEPSTLAVTGLGAVCLWLFRRRGPRPTATPRTPNSLRLLVIFAALSSTASVTCAQGLINWANTGSTLISVNGASMPVAVSPQTTYYFGLFIAPYGTAAPSWGSPGINDPDWQNVVAYTMNSTAAAGAGRLLNPGTATVPGYAPGTTVNFIVRGWQSFTGGADWPAAKPGLLAYGQSGLGFLPLGGGPFPTPNAFGVGVGQIAGLYWMPEPSSMALTGLGAVCLWWFRYRPRLTRRTPSSPKLLTIFAALCSTASLTCAQGLINWNNTRSTLISSGGQPIPVRTSEANTFYFGLFIAPHGTPAPWPWVVSDPNWQYVVDYTTNHTAMAGAGRMQNPGMTTVPGFPPGSTVSFLIRFWQSPTAGADWPAARPALYNYGESPIGSVILGGGALPAPSAFGIGPGQIGGFGNVWIPEPSTVALIGIGLAFVLFSRRRRRATQHPSDFLKLLLVMATFLSTASVTFSQGTMLWNNTSSTLISYWGAPMPPATSPATTFHFGLFIAPNGTPAPDLLDWDDPNWENVVSYTMNNTAAAGAGRLQNPGTVTVADYSAGSTINFIIRGWRSETGGADWAAARPGIHDYAQSDLGSVILGGGAFPVWNAFGTIQQPGIRQVDGFSFLIPIPEPSSVALVGLGALACVFSRRRFPFGHRSVCPPNATGASWSSRRSNGIALANQSLIPRIVCVSSRRDE